MGIEKIMEMKIFFVEKKNAPEAGPESKWGSWWGRSKTPRWRYRQFGLQIVRNRNDDDFMDRYI